MMSIDIVMQLLYGTALLTTIIVAPLATLDLDVDEKDQRTAKARYLEVMFYAAVSLVLTAMALMHSLVTSPRWRKQNSVKILLAMLPWMLVCCIHFLMNVMLQLKAIFNVATETRQKTLIYALGFYCAIFGLALEQMLHWNVVFHLMTDGVITSISNSQLPLVIF
ncbi:uncharacterized protein LOC6610182 [Drosophila sechellia]|nr:uncharacterized protein LOC6610182 [Drosophila sechellia]